MPCHCGQLNLQKLVIAAVVAVALCVSSSQGFHRLLPTSSIPSLRRMPTRTCSSRRSTTRDRTSTHLYDNTMPVEEPRKDEPKTTSIRRQQRRRDKIAAKLRALTELEEKQDQYFFVLAVLPSLVAFFAWEEISVTLGTFLETYGIAKQDSAGVFATNVLRPTITGVVVPVIAIALATLMSTTINVLRDREVELRTLINKECCDLHLLRQAVLGMFGTRQHAPRRARALGLLKSYVKGLERECNVGAVEALSDLQLSGGIAANELTQLTKMLHGLDGAAASRQGSVSYADDLIRSLNDYRSQRVAELLSGFPAIHWGVLILLSLSVCGTFLLASNQPMDHFLNSVSLRVLFALLVGVCSGIASICLNLADPFSGTFSMLEASAQLRDLRLSLEEDVVEATAEAQTISTSLAFAKSRMSFVTSSSKKAVVQSEDTVTNQSDDALVRSRGSRTKIISDTKHREPRRYGLVPTVYFHLLTGPFGSNVKALGDLLAWFISFVTSRTRALTRRVSAFSLGLGRKR